MGQADNECERMCSVRSITCQCPDVIRSQRKEPRLCSQWPLSYLHGNQGWIEVEKKFSQNVELFVWVDGESFWGDTFSVALKRNISKVGVAKESHPITWWMMEECDIITLRRRLVLLESSNPSIVTWAAYFRPMKRYQRFRASRGDIFDNLGPLDTGQSEE